MTKPIRIQLSRKKGFKLPPNTVNVARPSKWGNPFKVGQYVHSGLVRDRAEAVRLFKAMIEAGGEVRSPEFVRENIRKNLRGKNLACWCPIWEPCHADVLLNIANA